MADEVFSVKIGPELKLELEQLAEESGLNRKEFIARLIASHKARNAREAGCEIPEISSLMQHVQRIEEIYISLAKSREDILAEANRRENELSAELQAVKAELVNTQNAAELAKVEAQELIDSVLAKAEDQAKAFETKISEHQDRAEKFEEMVRLTKQLLVAEQQLKITAETQAAELADKATAAENAQAELINLQTALAAFEKKIADMEAKHAAEIANLKEHAQLEQEKAVLAAEKASFEQIQALQNALHGGRFNKSSKQTG